MSEQGEISKIPAKQRKTTFNEVSCGFTLEEVLKEAGRCLQCSTAPCSKGCPAGINVKEFIRLIREKDYSAALVEIKKCRAVWERGKTRSRMNQLWLWEGDILGVWFFVSSRGR